MFDGMGGPNGLLPADLMHLTDDQVESLFLRPLAALARRLDREGDDDDGDDQSDGDGETNSVDALRRELAELSDGSIPPEVLEAEIRKIAAARAAGEG